MLAWLFSFRPLNRDVRERVDNIHKFVPNAVWRHVSSQENPADLVYRGIKCEPFLENSLVSWSSLVERSQTLGAGVFHRDSDEENCIADKSRLQPECPFNGPKKSTSLPVSLS